MTVGRGDDEDENRGGDGDDDVKNAMNGDSLR